MVKIYLNDQHLFLEKSTELTGEIPAVDYKLLIDDIKNTGVSRTIHTSDPAAELEKIKGDYHLVKAGGGLVTTKDGFILLIHRKGMWDLPKGKLEEGEDLAACALREVEEETGLQDITLVNKLCITYHTYTERGDAILKESHWYNMEVAQKQHLSPQTEEDIEQCLWVAMDDIEDYYEGAHASIRDVLQLGIPQIRQRLTSGSR